MELSPGILQDRILEWVAIPFSKGSSQLRNRTQVSCIAGEFFYSLSQQGSPRILAWVTYPFARGSSWSRNQTRVSCIAGGFFTSWATRKASSQSLHSSKYLLFRSLIHVRLFVTPGTAACQASLSITISLSLLKLLSIESVMPSNHPILCRPLLLVPSIFLSIRVFSNELALRIRWPKYWSFSFSISPSNEYSRLISFRID